MESTKKCRKCGVLIGSRLPETEGRLKGFCSVDCRSAMAGELAQPPTFAEMAGFLCEPGQSTFLVGRIERKLREIYLKGFRAGFQLGDNPGGGSLEGAILELMGEDRPR